MNIKTFNQIIDKSQASKSAAVQSGVLGKIMCFNKEASQIRLHYVENKLITYKITHKPSFIERFLLRRHEVKRQNILIIADGSTGSVAVVDSLPDIVSADKVDESIIQFSSYSDDELINKGKKAVLRIVHKHIGSIPEVEGVKVESVFRPYWIVIYGEFTEGKKVRYTPVPADGCGAYRTF